MDLPGKIALVTGANRGLGTAFVNALVARGATVYAAARRPTELDQIVANGGGKIIPLELDVTDPASISAAADAASDVDFLVNNADRLEQLSLAEAGNVSALRAEMDVNVFGLAQMSLEFAPVIAGNGGGAIVNMLSIASLLPFGPFGTYAASKAAAMSLTHSMRWDFQKLGVDVIGIYAGFIDTGMIDNLAVEKSTPEAIVENALSGIEAGKLDIATDEPSTIRCAQFQGHLDQALEELFERADLFRTNFPISGAD